MLHSGQLYFFTSSWYIITMHNWDYPRNNNQQTDEIWRLERLLQYGLGGEKIDRALLEENFKMLHIPDNTKAFLELLLCNKAF